MRSRRGSLKSATLAAALAGTLLHPRSTASGPTATDDEEVAKPVSDSRALERAYRDQPDSQKRALLIQHLAGMGGGADILARVITDDPSDDVALAAAYALRRTVVGQVVGLLEQRLQMGKRDGEARERLLRELERHQVFAAGQNLPRFVREAPPVFTIRGLERRGVRVLAFGDFGDGSERQERMAAAMRRFHARTPFDLAVTVGDNFYPGGLGSPDDPRWDRDFARLYEPMHVRFFPTLGNHDWVLADSPAAEIAHSLRARFWQMPADRYSFVAGPIQFFAIDTNLISHAQLEWLDRELGRSSARWKIVYGTIPSTPMARIRTRRPFVAFCYRCFGRGRPFTCAATIMISNTSRPKTVFTSCSPAAGVRSRVRFRPGRSHCSRRARTGLLCLMEPRRAWS